MEWDEIESEPENDEEPPRDQVIDSAKSEIQAFFNEKSRRPNVYYLTQLQVIFEKRFFHWIVGKAVSELVREQTTSVTVSLSCGKIPVSKALAFDLSIIRVAAQ